MKQNNQSTHGSSDGSRFAYHTDDLRVVGLNLARSRQDLLQSVTLVDGYVIHDK